MEVDIYDFDKTIVPMDSGSRFYFFCLLRYPWILLFAPLHLMMGMLLLLHIIKLNTFKRYFFCFIAVIPLDKAVKKFWDTYEKTVFPWFKDRKRFSVIISASPDFLLNEIAKRLHFDALICTRHNRKNGLIIGENCKNKEKIKRFKNEFPEVTVVDVYSDSIKHDKPIFALGQNCIHIVNGKKVPFDFDKMHS